MTIRHWCLQLTVAGFLAWSSIDTFTSKTLAQSNIVPDDTLKTESSRIISNQTSIDVITGGATHGSNLFHSFQEFNVSENRGAYFLSPNADIQNILARVTGKERSQILGTLGTFGKSQPNLYLINPNGIIFGKNAVLDVGGSFIATTANAVKLGDTGNFSATQPASSNLLAVKPSALFYNAVANQAQIINRSTATTIPKSVINNSRARPTYGLQVLDGKSLLLVGGDVTLDNGFLSTLGGRVELGGLVESGTINLNEDGSNLSLSFPDKVLRSNVSLTNGADVFVAADNRGDIAINAQSLGISNSRLLAENWNRTESSIAGNININAQEVNLQNRSVIANLVLTQATGNAGDIRIQTNVLAVSDGSQINSLKYGEGNAGNIIIQARDRVTFVGTLDDVPSGIYNTVEKEAIGNTGDIRINTNSLSVTNGAELNISIYGKGNAGDIVIQARGETAISNGLIFNTVKPEGEGKGGDVIIDTGSLNLTQAGQIGAIARGIGDAGSVTIQAKDDVTVSNYSAIFSAPIYSDDRVAIGNSGGINIHAKSFRLDDVSQLVSSTFTRGNAGKISIQVDDSVVLKNGEILSTVDAPVFEGSAVGNSGGIEITAKSLELNESRLIASTYAQGDAGKISLQIRDNVSLANSDILNTVGEPINSSGVGNSNGIEIHANSIALGEKAKIVSSTFGEGNAGSIKLRASDSISLVGGDTIESFSEINFIDPHEIELPRSFSAANLSDGVSTGVFSTVEDTANGNAGDITIQARSLSLNNGAEIQSLTRGNGNAGNINVNASDAISASGVAPKVLVQSIFSGDFIGGGYSSGFISASESGALGRAGNINVNTGTLELSEGAVLNARTRSNFPGGDITVRANKLDIDSGGQILASSFSRGKAGNVQLDIGDAKIAGRDRTFELRQQQFGSDIVDTEAPNSGLFGRSQSNENNLPKAGQINLTANNVAIDRQGTITTATTSSDGGDINLQVKNSLSLRGGGQISTNAGTAQTGGDGGNININSKVIVAYPQENSDITANAYTGTGGNVQINAQAIFGIESRSQLTNQSDITASSERGIAGLTNIYSPATEAIQNSLNQLPENIIDTNTLLANSCIAQRRNPQSSSFLITGSGIPQRPGDAVASPFPTASIRAISPQRVSSPRPWKVGDPVIEPQGVYQLASGKHILSRNCE